MLKLFQSWIENSGTYQTLLHMAITTRAELDNSANLNRQLIERLDSQENQMQILKNKYERLRKKLRLKTKRGGKDADKS